MARPWAAERRRLRTLAALVAGVAFGCARAPSSGDDWVPPAGTRLKAPQLDWEISDALVARALTTAFLPGNRPTHVHDVRKWDNGGHGIRFKWDQGTSHLDCTVELDHPGSFGLCAGTGR